MKRTPSVKSVPVLVAMLLGVLLSPSLASALSIGDAAPARDVKMRSTDGREIAISDVAGEKGTLVVFTCNHCPFAKDWEGRIVALANVYRKSGIGVLGINPDDPGVASEDSFDEMARRASERGYDFPYAVDAASSVARAFGATKLPEVFLFDAKGRLAYHGAIDDESENPHAVESPYLKNALDAVLEGKSPFPAETKPLGCGIKFRKGPADAS